jgi:hypothetical protein
MNTETERWRPIPGHEEYSISSLGRIRSEYRQFIKRDGQLHTVNERIMKPTRHRSGRLSVILAHRGHYTRIWPHLLVPQLFGEQNQHES